MQNEIGLYMEHAYKMLQAAEYNLAGEFYGSAVNRAYYAVFYAANALLATLGLSRSKHSGVIAAFRMHFVKTGLIEAEHSRVYGRLMDDRYLSDYEVALTIDPDVARQDLDGARDFVKRVQRYLEQEQYE
jgi:uncharacterized protein (UPF0332 family)